MIKYVCCIHKANLYIRFTDSLIHVKCLVTMIHMKSMHSFILDNPRVPTMEADEYLTNNTVSKIILFKLMFHM